MTTARVFCKSFPPISACCHLALNRTAFPELLELFEIMNTSWIKTTVAAAGISLSSVSASFAHTMLPAMDHSDVTKIVAAAEQEITQDKLNGTIAVVDASGQLVFLERQDGALTNTVDNAIRKARTSALYGMPSVALMDRLTKGNNVVLGIPHSVPLGGGYPLKVGDTVVGAVGISTQKAADDVVIAQKAAATFN